MPFIPVRCVAVAGIAVDLLQQQWLKHSLELEAHRLVKGVVEVRYAEAIG